MYERSEKEQTMLQTADHSRFMTPLLERVLTAAGLQAEQGYQCVPAGYLRTQYHPTVEVELPLIVRDLVAQDIPYLQAVLQNAYPAAHPLTLLDSASANHEPVLIQTTVARLATLASESSATAGAVWVLCVPPLPAGSSFSALQAIIAHLRSPVGCPWDRKQTLQSMRHDLLGECAEVLEAIDLDSTLDNGPHIAEELGDLFMAAALMVQIATDAGRFQMAHTMHSIVTKLIRRHPHVFGDTVVDGVEAVLVNWDAIKAKEKAAKGQTQVHPLAGVPAVLPALEKARELQSKAAKAGLLDRTTVAQADLRLGPDQDTPLTEEELGELLWRIVALAYTAGLNAEDALRSYCIRFRESHDPQPAP